MKFDTAVLKAAALGRWPSILADLGGLDPAILDGKHHPCPKCGGKDRFRLVDQKAGAVFCNACFTTGNGDGLSALQWACGWSFKETVVKMAEHLGIQPSQNGHAKQNGKPAGQHIQRRFATPEGVIRQLTASLEREHGPGVKFVRAWDYKAFCVLRFDLPMPVGEKQRKTFRPVHRVPIGSEGRMGWALGYPQPDEGRPLYRLAEIEALPDDATVTVHGGEKAADAAHDLGLPATTCAGGEGAIAKTDWKPLARFSRADVVIDNDEKGEQFGQGLSVILKRLNPDMVVKIIRLPGLPLKGDIVEAIEAGLTREQFLELAEAAPAVTDEEVAEWGRTAGKPGTGGPLIDAKELDPATEARRFLAASEIDGVPTVRFWRGTFLAWERGAYREVSSSDVQSQVVHRLNTQFRKLNNRIIGDVMGQLRAQAALHSTIEPPTWLGEPPAFGDTGETWPEDSVLVARNGLVHLPSLVEGRDYFHSPTPRFFSTAALDYDFNVKAPAPRTLLVFLSQLWPDDSESVATLQEWAGYCLTASTAQQKILALVGPRRSGKGTIGRVLRGLIGQDNVAGPTFAGLASHFGPWGLLNRPLAIISDARLSGRTDQAAVVERLLTISGEDCLMVDRKCLPPVHAKLPTRLMILTNELPKLGDSSGALVGRLILLQLRESFYGYEDTALTSRLLEELPGILLWAIEGWRRLQKRGHFEQPRASLDMLNELQDLASPISAFVRECCTAGPGRRTPVDDLFAAWGKWCEMKGRREPGTVQSFARDLLAAVPTLRKVQPRDGRDRYRAYEGIGLLTNW